MSDHQDHHNHYQHDGNYQGWNSSSVPQHLQQQQQQQQQWMSKPLQNWKSQSIADVTVQPSQPPLSSHHQQHQQQQQQHYRDELTVHSSYQPTSVTAWQQQQQQQQQQQANSFITPHPQFVAPVAPPGSIPWTTNQNSNDPRLRNNHSDIVQQHLLIEQQQHQQQWQSSTPPPPPPPSYSLVEQHLQVEQHRQHQQQQQYGWKTQQLSSLATDHGQFGTSNNNNTQSNHYPDRTIPSNNKIPPPPPPQPTYAQMLTQQPQEQSSSKTSWHVVSSVLPSSHSPRPPLPTIHVPPPPQIHHRPPPPPPPPFELSPPPNQNIDTIGQPLWVSAATTTTTRTRTPTNNNYIPTLVSTIKEDPSCSVGFTSYPIQNTTTTNNEQDNNNNTNNSIVIQESANDSMDLSMDESSVEKEDNGEQQQQQQQQQQKPVEDQDIPTLASIRKYDGHVKKHASIPVKQDQLQVNENNNDTASPMRPATLSTKAAKRKRKKERQRERRKRKELAREAMIAKELAQSATAAAATSKLEKKLLHMATKDGEQAQEEFQRFLTLLLKDPRSSVNGNKERIISTFKDHSRFQPILSKYCTEEPSSVVIKNQHVANAYDDTNADYNDKESINKQQQQKLLLAKKQRAAVMMQLVQAKKQKLLLKQEQSSAAGATTATTAAVEQDMNDKEKLQQQHPTNDNGDDYNNSDLVNDVTNTNPSKNNRYLYRATGAPGGRIQRRFTPPPQSLPPITALQKGVNLCVLNISSTGPSEKVRWPELLEQGYYHTEEEEEEQQEQQQGVANTENNNSSSNGSDDNKEVGTNGGDNVPTPVVQASREKSESIQQNLQLLKRKLELKLKVKKMKKQKTNLDTTKDSSNDEEGDIHNAPGEGEEETTIIQPIEKQRESSENQPTCANEQEESGKDAATEMVDTEISNTNGGTQDDSTTTMNNSQPIAVPETVETAPDAAILAQKKQSLEILKRRLSLKLKMKTSERRRQKVSEEAKKADCVEEIKNKDSTTTNDCEHGEDESSHSKATRATQPKRQTMEELQQRQQQLQKEVQVKSLGLMVRKERQLLVEQQSKLESFPSKPKTAAAVQPKRQTMEELRKRQQQLQQEMEVKNLGLMIKKQRQLMVKQQMKLDQNAIALQMCCKEIEQEQKASAESDTSLQELIRRQQAIDDMVVTATTKLMSARRHLDSERARLSAVAAQKYNDG